MKLFIFELKKLVKRKTNIVAAGILMVALITLYFFNYTLAMSIHQKNMKKFETNLEEIPMLLEQLKAEKIIAEEKEDREALYRIEVGLEWYENELVESEAQLEGYKNENWEIVYPYQIEDYERLFINSLNPDRPDYFMEEQWGNWFTLKASLAERKLMLERKVEPFYQDEIMWPWLATIYDNFTGKAKQLWQEKSTRYGVHGYYFLYQLLPFLFIPIVMLLGCFIFANNVSLESGKKHRGMDFYKVLPISRKKLFFAKYFSSMVYCFLFTVLMLIIPLICSVFTKGLGNLKYPVLVYDGSPPSSMGKKYNVIDSVRDSFHFIDLGEYLGKTILLAFMLFIFLHSLYFLVSLFVKNPSINLVITSFLVFGGMMLLPKAAYNPLTYIDIHRTINQEIATLSFFNYSINFQNGLLSLFAAGVVTFILGYIKFNKGVKSS